MGHEMDHDDDDDHHHDTSKKDHHGDDNIVKGKATKDVPNTDIIRSLSESVYVKMHIAEMISQDKGIRQLEEKNHCEDNIAKGKATKEVCIV